MDKQPRNKCEQIEIEYDIKDNDIVSLKFHTRLINPVKLTAPSTEARNAKGISMMIIIPLNKPTPITISFEVGLLRPDNSRQQ